MQKSAKTIILIRHGNTAWNEKEIFRGQIDIELSDSGLKQAEALSSYLSQTQIDAIYSSPLKRAHKTAGAIAKSAGVEIIISPELTDFNFGEWQGKDSEHVRTNYKSAYNDWLNNPHHAKIPGGETLEQVRERATSLLNLIKVTDKNTIALVSHRVVLKVIICALLDLKMSHFWNIRIDTCGITTFGYDRDKFILLNHNDISFLKNAGMPELNDF